MCDFRLSCMGSGYFSFYSSGKTLVNTSFEISKDSSFAQCLILNVLERPN